MKYLFIFILIIITGTITFLIGENTGKKKARVIYLPKKIQSANSPANAPYHLNAYGTVKEINNNFITITNSRDTSTFRFNKQPDIYIKSYTSSSSSNIKDKESNKSFKQSTEKKGQLTDIRLGQIATLDFLISKDSISLNSITINIFTP